MELETMTPADGWEPAPGSEDAITALAAADYTFHVWGGDWCIDCQEQLPAFGAALEYAGVDDEQITHYPVDKKDDGSKTGPGVSDYGIEYIPTVVVERDGDEVARFVESGPASIAVTLGRTLNERITAETATTGE
jgi:thiol-disulfide isomerase/thioredoxin